MGIIRFDLNGNGYVNIWSDELPFTFNGDFMKGFRDYDTKELGNGKDLVIACEIFRHYGPKYSYGLVGIHYVSKNEKKVTVNMPVCDKNREDVFESDLISFKDISKGFPDEYFTALDEIREFPGGNVTLLSSAYSDIYSSIRSFKNIFHMCNLLIHDPGIENPETIDFIHELI